MYLIKVNKKNTTKRSKLYSKSTIKTTERHQERHFGIFIVNSEHSLTLHCLYSF